MRLYLRKKINIGKKKKYWGKKVCNLKSLSHLLLVLVVLEAAKAPGYYMSEVILFPRISCAMRSSSSSSRNRIWRQAEGRQAGGRQAGGRQAGGRQVFDYTVMINHFKKYHFSFSFDCVLFFSIFSLSSFLDDFFFF